MTEAQRPQVGEHHYRRALGAARRARTPISIANLAWNLKNQGRIEEARRLYEQSVRARSQHLPDLLRLGAHGGDRPQFRPRRRIARRRRTAVARQPQACGCRAPCSTAAARNMRARSPSSTRSSERRGGGGLGPLEWSEKGRLLDRMGRHARRSPPSLRQAHAARDQRPEPIWPTRRRRWSSACAASSPPGAWRSCRAPACAAMSPSRSSSSAFRARAPPWSSRRCPRIRSISAGDELPIINELTAIIPRMLNSPLAYPEALADLWLGDQIEGLDNLRDYYLQRARQLGALQQGRGLVHRQDAAQRDPSRPDRADLSAGADHSCVAPSARRGAVGVLQPSDARLLLRLRSGEHRAPLRAGHGPGRALSARDGAALSAGPLRGHRRRPGDRMCARC